MKTKFTFFIFLVLFFVGCSTSNPPENPEEPNDPEEPGNPEEPNNPPIVTVDSLGVSISEIHFTCDKDASLIIVKTNTS
ncbi:MAG TPA: hypothetical protein PLE52_07260 [Paludibacteraceae bacterium]|nr:hypothetical protein [Paludibacteraceae bacterium]